MIAIITGGTSSEREISLRSAQNVVSLLNSAFRVEVFDFPNDRQKFVERAGATELAIPIIHGRGGEDGEVQAFLETLNVPYLFSEPKAHQVALDKELAKEIVRRGGITTPQARTVRAGEPCRYLEPVVVKPIDGGSSVATTIAHSQEELNRAINEALLYSDRVLVERCIVGDEFTVAVVEQNGKSVALPVISIHARDGFFDFTSKYDSTCLAEEICPAPISVELSKRLQETALLAHTLLGCRHVSRTDIIVDKNGVPWFLETNTIPGMTATSLLPKALYAAGFDLGKILHTWIAETVREKEKPTVSVG